MKLKIFKSFALIELKNSIENNIDKYMNGDFSSHFADPGNLIELNEIDINEDKFGDFIPGNTSREEVHNCLLMKDILGEITPYLARDERLWVFLTHSYLLNYSRQRWELSKKSGIDLVRHIRTHFFATDKRGIERANAASRLWWISALCSRVENVEINDLLECFLYSADVRANIIERPTTSQCLNVFSAITKKLFYDYKSGNHRIFDRRVFRVLMKELNLFGGIKLLNTMKEKDITDFIDKHISVTVS
jgi:hypothetical protein